MPAYRVGFLIGGFMIDPEGAPPSFYKRGFQPEQKPEPKSPEVPSTAESSSEDQSKIVEETPSPQPDADFLE
jgi:hypothetical protein